MTAQLVHRIRPHMNVIAQKLDDQLVLLHIQTNQFYELNSTAARLWQLLSDGLSFEQIKAQILCEYDVQPEQLEAELVAMLTELKKRELVVTDE